MELLAPLFLGWQLDELGLADVDTELAVTAFSELTATPGIDL